MIMINLALDDRLILASDHLIFQADRRLISDRSSFSEFGNGYQKTKNMDIKIRVSKIKFDFWDILQGIKCVHLGIKCDLCKVSDGT